MEDNLKKVVTLLGQWLVFMPSLFCFSYVLRPIMMALLIPGGLLFLALIGGSEVRDALKQMMQER
ncbi:hypothetical protein ACK1CN_05620 [Vibrio coralliilyticus]|uniref:Uncharacterized protein n=1 Tax=Vibrio coralliilyticus TaxID=190893 RepID=A0AAP6ZSD9_9VIBR|nr:hypothetical protein [Vibrio coralliilyticus]AIW19183.1 hypothetical protein IX92_09000 [Vibrio coralliilyticus]AXN30828.1 hypothetical protein DVV14_05650 [Vibrio coralliilyticus]KPH27209.1 hypothetical protein ADU60_02805 [Vibrio coralliilyticus]NOH40955.1 hypothetical protein [Vibrio coralliilyticus]NOJ24930.1 hypothetical protein [Vibrio coralliilyticus]